MPRFLIKATRDRDAYIEWSTVTDSPVSIGTRAEYAAAFGESRLARTDRNGTSAKWFDAQHGELEEGGWADESLIVVEGAEHPGMLPRERLGDLYDLLSADINAPIPADWVTPFPDDDETDARKDH